jgi:cell wall-associated NlpC family hydrolase
LTSDGEALISEHLQPVREPAPDYVSVAELFLNTPYLWGGTTGFGIDCSGLVQTSMMMAGRKALRDTDMQEASLGVEIDPDYGLRRGDLVFWKGHVAIMTDPRMMIHANGHTMMVSREPLADAVARIGYLYGQPTRYRRP